MHVWRGLLGSQGAGRISLYNVAWLSEVEDSYGISKLPAWNGGVVFMFYARKKDILRLFPMGRPIRNRAIVKVYAGALSGWITIVLSDR